MKTRLDFWLTLFWITLFLPAAAAATPKSGVGAWQSATTATLMQNVGAQWYFTWSPKSPFTPPAGVPFVPMIWDERDVTAAKLTDAKNAGAGSVLVFNEPDMAAQANMTPTQALDLWPQLMATGLRLGSPAVAASATQAGAWQDQFMAGAKTRGHRVDFMCIHWYGSSWNANAFDPVPQVTYLKSYLTAIHDKYGIPIWLTEFALVRWEPAAVFPKFADQARFVELVLPMLESLPFVERYAWFAILPSIGAGSTNQLYEADGSLTATGIAYRNTAGPVSLYRMRPGSRAVSLGGDPLGLVVSRPAYTVSGRTLGAGRKALQIAIIR